MNNVLFNILNDMSEHLNMSQMKKLQEVLIKRIESLDETQILFDSLMQQYFGRDAVPFLLKIENSSRFK